MQKDTLNKKIDRRLFRKNDMTKIAQATNSELSYVYSVSCGQRKNALIEAALEELTNIRREEIEQVKKTIRKSLKK